MGWEVAVLVERRIHRKAAWVVSLADQEPELVACFGQELRMYTSAVGLVAAVVARPILDPVDLATQVHRIHRILAWVVVAFHPLVVVAAQVVLHHQHQ